jgi:hypothetical protein
MSVEVCDAPNTIEGVVNEQVGVDVRFVGATLQVSATVPVNPPVGATVITDVPEFPSTTVGLLAEVRPNPVERTLTANALEVDDK